MGVSMAWRVPKVHLIRTDQISEILLGDLTALNQPDCKPLRNIVKPVRIKCFTGEAVSPVSVSSN